MDSFIIRFLICNLLISIIICILFAINYLLRNILTAGMKYRLWLLLPGFMSVPFFPHELTDFLLQFSWSSTLLRSASSVSVPAAASLKTAEMTGDSGWMNDFTLSVNRGIPSQLPVILWGIWAAGVAVMLLLTAYSLYRLHIVKKSALPLQNREIHQIYDRCLAGFLPFLSVRAGTGSAIHYQWNTAGKMVSDLDVSSYFGENQGTFVLYDMENDTWSIYNRNRAALRVSPDSTWKIYAALAGLEEGIITPDNSLIAWDGSTYPFETWNQDQNLQTAMEYSVNWYFQEMEVQMGKKTIEQYLHDIGYGNEDTSGDSSSFWLESSLKISPVEQVELLVRLYRNDFDIAPENINAVKDSIRIVSDGSTTLYGKTGTGRVNGQDVNGWFIGYAEKTEGTYFFAVNISADAAAASMQDSNVKDRSASENYTGTREATGSRAAEIALSILNEKNIWREP